MPAAGLATLPTCQQAVLLGEVLSAPIPSLPTCRGGPWMPSGATQGDSPSLLPWNPAWFMYPEAFPVLEHEARWGQALQPARPAPACE